MPANADWCSGAGDWCWVASKPHLNHLSGVSCTRLSNVWSIPFRMQSIFSSSSLWTVSDYCYVGRAQKEKCS